MRSKKVQNGIQKWDPKVGFKSGIQKWDPNGDPKGDPKVYGAKKENHFGIGKYVVHRYVLMNSVSNTPCY